jgi:hypothetical protein
LARLSEGIAKPRNKYRIWHFRPLATAGMRARAHARGPTGMAR